MSRTATRSLITRKHLSPFFFNASPPHDVSTGYGYTTSIGSTSKTANMTPEDGSPNTSHAELNNAPPNMPYSASPNPTMPVMNYVQTQAQAQAQAQVQAQIQMQAQMYANMHVHAREQAQWAAYYQWTTWQHFYHSQRMMQTGGPEHPVFAPAPNPFPFATVFNAEPQYFNAQAQPFLPGAYHPNQGQAQGTQQQAPASPIRKVPSSDRQKRDPKLMLPAPEPTSQYRIQAMGEPEAVDPPTPKLVILDLNGTLLYRPSRKQPTKMIGRPYLTQFLNYLFENFSVMVWSSARPDNVKALVDTGLGPLQDQLVARWARDTLGLSPQHYNMNVQCYKNLDLVWDSEVGKGFNQSNTILIDDSALKASAQPFNLLEIPEFTGESSPNDVLGEVAGYLELLRMQEDVSKFIFKTPFKANQTWSYNWELLGPALQTEGEELQPVTLGA
ncbi:HAD-like protein [Massarina eburnea CBS 473.64]|uniref:Mitochondrial import inner membrane translocase subunit TIM50 n=1 Tax=Massarina eburnea CBS 473.64 TaxID=1395130 RepID=A0A6A6RYX2_9PLEO|nr:HAD-like protein [Massarina eburnea CBS 473.64]